MAQLLGEQSQADIVDHVARMERVPSAAVPSPTMARRYVRGAVCRTECESGDYGHLMPQPRDGPGLMSTDSPARTASIACRM